MYKLYKITTICLVLSAFSISVFASGDLLRDPTKPLAYRGEFATNISGHNIIISAIFAGKDHNSVIVGKHTFVVGDKIANLVITNIDVDGITLKNEGGGELRVKMPYSAVKLPTTKK